jgi:septal ring factor EnvC (AmiA/AmiB activator)
MDNIYTVLVTLAGTLGGTTAWRYYEKRAMKKDEEDSFIRHDCQSRISKLEALLFESSKEKEELRNQIIKLVEEVATLRTEIKYLQQNK